MKFIKYSLYLILAFITFFYSSCSSDQEITQGDADEELVESSKSFLNGEIVLSTKATLSGVDKTLLPEGCPTKFN